MGSSDSEVSAQSQDEKVAKPKEDLQAHPSEFHLLRTSDNHIRRPLSRSVIAYHMILRLFCHPATPAESAF
ncbi:hypothetical protein BGW80DRAFT_1351656 [Lactifluus volemus]|nr:hypothetical protein BGW80DRAFT_1351656 [Lactifluus volemus]